MKIFNTINPAPGFGLLVLLLLFTFNGSAQNAERKYLGYEKEENSVTVKTGDGEYHFIYYTPEIVETSFIPSGEKFNPESQAVTLEPQPVQFSVEENKDSLTLDSEGIDVTILKSPFQVLYYFKGGKIISEKTGYSKDKNHEKLDFNIDLNEIISFSGTGELGINRRGNKTQVDNGDQYEDEGSSEMMNFTLPIFFSSEKYMIHFDDTSKGFLDLNSEKTNTVAYETISGRITYQLIVGDSWERLIENYTLLTGRQPMPPRWALGNISSRIENQPQKEVPETIQRLKEDSIPVDAVIIDPVGFFTEMKSTTENPEFQKDSIPTPEKMMAVIENQGVNTIFVTYPYISTTSNRWEEAVENEVLITDATGKPFIYNFPFGKAGLVDIFKSEARDWFWNYYKELAEIGVAGWSLNIEPVIFPSELSQVTESAVEKDKFYTHTWAKMIYEGYKEDFPDRRPFILLREGVSGSQNFGMIPWHKEDTLTWDSLSSQPEIAVQMGIQGMPYMYSVPGGFPGENLNDDLYLRWLQYGVFQPIFRTHTKEEMFSGPVFLPPATREMAKKAIRLRHKLIPYNYTLAFENSRNGMPFMRPLFFEEPENREIYNVANPYLWGNDFLISPVMDSSVVSKEVYFPGADNWFDFYSGTKYKGGNAQSISVNKDHIPTFVRGGAFIPMTKTVQSTSNYSAANFQIHYYYDSEVKESKGRVYHDDGKTPDSFENGKYELLNLTSSSDENSLTITVEKEEGENSDSEIQMVEVIIENLKRPVEVVWVKTLRFTSKNFMHEGKLVIPVRFDQSKTTIKLEFN